MTHKLYSGNTPLHFSDKKAAGEYVQMEGETYYKISNSDRMKPFFMSIVSDSDHWMFISSNGALSAGRKNPDHALFPYYTDDKITDSPEITGSKSIFQVHKDGKVFLWEPFSDRYFGAYDISRNLYKNYFGNKILFEEINHDLGLCFSYSWSNSERYGFAKKSKLINAGKQEISVQLLDGIQNILPAGVEQNLQTVQSTLVDAYKKNELHKASGLGLFVLSAIIVDKPVPSESLRATTVFSLGLDQPKRMLSSVQVNDFRRGQKIEEETDVRAERGAYFVNSTIEIPAGEEKQWFIIADIDQGPSQVAGLINQLNEEKNLVQKIENDIKEGTGKLMNIVAGADGLQLSADGPCANRHYSNVLFNVMRGGIIDQNYTIPISDYQQYIRHFNKSLYQKQEAFLTSLSGDLTYQNLLEEITKIGDPDLERLTIEYLPIVFSRRHGDPSRPWNRFSIETKNPDGSKSFKYEGNWRDIFQNWEALALSFPGFLKGMITKFVNASTIDGYNPYRITKDGIDWEVIEPDNPWSFIGYWGDHQIIYLLKLMEIAQNHDPEILAAFLSKDIFSYANVPYKIKSYEEILKNPRDTIEFDEDSEKEIELRVENLGGDGKMILNESGGVHLVNFTEKLLVTVLAKFSNFIPEGGIWLNTQRPEWNDANNALVGNGVSMVTLYYMYRFQLFCKQLFDNSEITDFSISKPLSELLDKVTTTFEKHSADLSGNISNGKRKTILDELGNAGNNYRNSVYKQEKLSDKQQVSKNKLNKFIDLSISYLDHSIKANKRSDGMYHAYNLMSVKNGGEVEIGRLYEMLEGQVAVLSAGSLSPEETVEVLDALKNSSMFREDQHSYILYPDRQLPLFLKKNNIPENRIQDSALLQILIDEGNKELIEKDVFGKYHFHASFNNADDVKEVLCDLESKEYKNLVEQDRQLVLDIFEELFDHKSFTGRSGTFFGYEGLGSIYWHMVSKLLLAVQENYFRALEKGADAVVLGKLKEHYFEIRAGIGTNKPPDVYGAFPSDPYSHTPGNAGAQQPGMTGQVKEDILTRFGELGVFVKEGKIHFAPSLLQKSEFLATPKSFAYYDIHGNSNTLELSPDSLAFTYCQVPIIYQLSEEESMELIKENDTQIIRGRTIDSKNSDSIFERTGKILSVKVYLKAVAF